MAPRDPKPVVDPLTSEWPVKALPITDRVTIPARDLSWVAVRSSGPGGQHVNKVSTKVALRFDLVGTDVLTETQKRRLRELAGKRLDSTGGLVVTAQAERSQSRNLERARESLRRLVYKALVAPKRRVATMPSKAQKRRRLEDKRWRSEKKQRRATVRFDE